MAEIRIEEKRGNLAWLWILLLVLIVAAAAWYMMSDRTAAPVAPAPADSVGMAPAAPAAPSAAPSTVDSVSLQLSSSTPRMRLLNA